VFTQNSVCIENCCMDALRCLRVSLLPPSSGLPLTHFSHYFLLFLENLTISHFFWKISLFLTISPKFFVFSPAVIFVFADNSCSPEMHPALHVRGGIFALIVLGACGTNAIIVQKACETRSPCPHTQRLVWYEKVYALLRYKLFDYCIILSEKSKKSQKTETNTKKLSWTWNRLPEIVLFKESIVL